jgi:hypothetical protein
MDGGVFLKPLSPGDHSIFYHIRVNLIGALTSAGISPHFADITYSLQVIEKKKQHHKSSLSFIFSKLID